MAYLGRACAARAAACEHERRPRVLGSASLPTRRAARACIACGRRIGQVLLVDAPWLFKGPWEVIKPLLRKYASLVRFASRQELAAEFFSPDTLPPVFRQ